MPNTRNNAHLDKGRKAFTGAFTGFGNAFGTLPRHRLLDKFAAPNPSYWLKKWVHIYFTGRNQYTLANNKVSSAIPNNCGVLQGAVLFHSSYLRPLL